MSNSQTRKLKVVRTSTQPLRLEPGETVHVGVDVHKASYSVALYSDARGVLTTWVQPARPEVLLERLRPLRAAIARVVYEAGPTGFGLARRLRAEGYKAEVIAPSKLLAPVGPESKSDRLDCRRLAQLSAKGLLHSVLVPTEQEEADRQVLRPREQLVGKTRSVQSQIKGFLLQHGIAEPAGLGHWSKASLAALRRPASSEGRRAARVGRIERRIGEPRCARRCRRTDARMICLGSPDDEEARLLD
jgi:transposase